MSVWRRLLIGGLLVVGCGSTPPVTSNPVADEAGPDGHRRLDHAVVPLRYDLDLTVDPAEAAYAGQAQIAVRLEAARAVVELHGRDLDVDSVTAAVGAAERKGRAVQGPNGGLALVFAEPLPAGEVTLKLSFRARLPEVPNGLYRVKEGGLWYAFTQFEPMYARQAFPCFDQPEFKTPYRVTLRVPQGQLALANSPEQSRRDELGLTVFEFAETKPLPTYLVAFAVGEFDVVEAPADAIPNLPLRLVATKGKGRLAKYALERAPVIHKALSDYFGTPHPFAKLDLVAVPNFAAGAMENVGLITFRETLLLLDEASAPANHKMWSQSVIAHEMAHMWFGNEVTLAWWDDLWLNEAFATWTAAWVVASVDPELEMDLERVAGTAWVMDLDAQAHTRSIRQPIAHGGDVHNAFDGITYGKGAAVLRMLESWIGRETFRDGVRAYLAAHAYGTATTSDLLEALARQSGKAVAETAKWFLDQPGTPLVQIDVLCTEGGPATLGLSQRRALPAGSTAPQGEPWHVPMCVRYGIGEEVHRECFLLEGKQQTVALHAPGCPAWLSGNDDQRGYYQWRTSADALLALAGEHYEALTPAERVALPGMLRTLLEADALPLGAYLDGLRQLARRSHRLVVQGVVNGLGLVYGTAVDEQLAEPFAALVRELLGPHAERLGFSPKEGEPIAVRLLRPQVLAPLAYMGLDQKLRAQARALTEQWLSDPQALDGELLDMVLPMAAWDGDAVLWTRLLDTLKANPDPVARVAIIGALASFEDPQLATRAFDLLLDGTLRAQDLRTVGGGITVRTRPAAWAWLTSHYDALVAVVGDTARPRLPWMGGGFCTTQERAQVATFFGAPEHAPEGTERNLGLVLEGIDRCIRLRASLHDPLATWLTNHAKGG